MTRFRSALTGRLAVGAALFGYAVLGLAGAAQAQPVAGSATAEAHASAAAAATAYGSGFVVPTADEATRFEVDYVLDRDGSVLVTQNITWEFPGTERHGIERNVKVRVGYQDREDVYRYYELSEVSAQSPTGAPTDISVTDFGAFKRIRIGSPSETVSGTHEYVVTFRLANIVNDVGDTAEFYYNLVDVSNANQYRNVSATVTAPEPADRAACFYGERGATDQCEASPGDTSTFRAPDLGSAQGVSILASYPRSAFDELAPDLREGEVGASDESALSPGAQTALGRVAIGTGVFLPLLAAGAMGALVWSRGRDEQYAGLTPGLTPGHGQTAPVVRGGARTVAVQFTPPEGVQPGLLGTVIDEEANTVDVSATVIDLAVRGYLTLEEVPRAGLFGRADWLLTRTEPTQAFAADNRRALTSYEQRLLDALFAAGPSVYLSSLKNHFASTLAAVQRDMYEEVVRRGWFRQSPNAQRRGWTTLGAVLAGAGAVTLFFGGTAVSAATGSFVPGVALALGLVAAGLIVRVLGKRMASRTAEGSAVLAQSLGFRQYLVTAEANQIRFEEATQVFSRFLPYAVVFGVADTWATTFRQVAEAAAAAGVPLSMPYWYIGPGTGFGGFEGIADGVDQFSTMAAGTFVSTPGSSGSSGFSTGGGFSGGGGGGDSGGSW